MALAWDRGTSALDAGMSELDPDIMSDRLFANTDITIIPRTAALRTDTTARSGLAVGSSSEQVRGIGRAGVMGIVTMAAATTVVAATMAADMTGIATMGVGATTETTAAGIGGADTIGIADMSGVRVAEIGIADTNGVNAAGLVVTIETTGADAVTAAADTAVAGRTAAATAAGHTAAATAVADRTAVDRTPVADTGKSFTLK